MKIHEIITEGRRMVREGIAHPEDEIFAQPGVQGAMAKVDKLAAMAVNPESTESAGFALTQTSNAATVAPRVLCLSGWL